MWVGAQVLNPGTVTGTDGSDLTSSFIPSDTVGDVTMSITVLSMEFNVEPGSGIYPYLCEYF